jgi:hypothetical protein
MRECGLHAIQFQHAPSLSCIPFRTYRNSPPNRLDDLKSTLIFVFVEAILSLIVDKNASMGRNERLVQALIDMDRTLHIRVMVPCMPRTFEPLLSNRILHTLALHFCQSLLGDIDQGLSNAIAYVLRHTDSKSCARFEMPDNLSFVVIDTVLHVSAALRLLWRM